jgi:hypothetical protein
MVSGVCRSSGLLMNNVVVRWYKSLILKDTIVCDAYYILTVKYFCLDFKTVNFISLAYEHFSSENHHQYVNVHTCYMLRIKMFSSFIIT